MSQPPKQRTPTASQTRRNEQAAELWRLIEPTGFVATDFAISNYQTLGPIWLLDSPLFCERHPQIADKIVSYSRMDPLTQSDGLLQRFNAPKRTAPRKPKPASMRKLEERQATEALQRAARELELRRRLAALRNRPAKNSDD